MILLNRIFIVTCKIYFKIDFCDFVDIMLEVEFLISNTCKWGNKTLYNTNDTWGLRRIISFSDFILRIRFLSITRNINLNLISLQNSFGCLIKDIYGISKLKYFLSSYSDNLIYCELYEYEKWFVRIISSFSFV